MKTVLLMASKHPSFRLSKVNSSDTMTIEEIFILKIVSKKEIEFVMTQQERNMIKIVFLLMSIIR